MKLALAKEDTEYQKEQSFLFASHFSVTKGRYSPSGRVTEGHSYHRSVYLLTVIDASWTSHSSVGLFQNVPWGLWRWCLGASHTLAVLLQSHADIVSWDPDKRTF